jgi:hypothetical protein
MSDDEFEIWSVILPTLAVAFAALCVWLGVRIFNRRERWAKRMALGLLVLALVMYPLSFGPAIRLANHGELPDWAFHALPYIYMPLNWLANHSRWCLELLDWYLGVWDNHRGH